jgi:hypothetical protein
MRTLTCLVVVLAGLARPFVAGAQDLPATVAPSVEVQGNVRQGQRPALPREPILRGYFMTDIVSMAASDSFDAVLGSSRVTMRGGGGEVLNIWRGLFARASFAAAREEGTRAIVVDGNVVPLDIALTIEVRPLEIGGGWRFPPFSGGHLVPYAGASILRVGYRERSAFGGESDDVDSTFAGRSLFGGIEAAVGGWVIVGAEVQYRSVPDALGQGGVSEAFGERDLGGAAVRVLVGIRH